MATRCSKVECANTPRYLLELSIIGESGRSSMHLCEECWVKLWNRMRGTAQFKDRPLSTRSGARRE